MIRSKPKTVRKRPTVKALKRKLTDRVRAMVRYRDAFNNCVSCHEFKRDKEDGHFIPRRKLATRWHPWNNNGECINCNRVFQGHLVGYAKSITERYGEGALELLAKLSLVNWKPLPDQLERLILACDNSEDYESEWFAVQREFAPELERE